MKAAVRRGGGSVLKHGIVVAAAACLLATGCSSNPAPGPMVDPPTQATSPSPTPVSDPSPSAAGPPTMPAAARGTSAKAAKAFVRYYIATINYAAATGSLSEARDATNSGCTSCLAMLRKIRRVYGAGGYFHGDGWRVTHIKYQPLQPADRPVLSVQLQLSPQVMLNREGGRIAHFPAARNVLTIRLTRGPTAWSVKDLERLR